MFSRPMTHDAVLAALRADYASHTRMRRYEAA
jgi:hypothetical protein